MNNNVTNKNNTNNVDEPKINVEPEIISEPKITSEPKTIKEPINKYDISEVIKVDNSDLTYIIEQLNNKAKKIEDENNSK